VNVLTYAKPPRMDSVIATWRTFFNAAFLWGAVPTLVAIVMLWIINASSDGRPRYGRVGYLMAVCWFFAILTRP
jgi:hypothetical protein